MCCFSITRPLGLLGWLRSVLTPPVHVSATQIFARMTAPNVQALAYSMNLDAREPVAMILPLPVATGSGESAVRFVSLEEHPHMFVDLAQLFALAAPASKGGISRGGGGPRLVVHRVGSFIASYVPTRADFTRLDPRFRVPDVLFTAVPHYADYGFAVFQLEPGTSTVHPMALTFPTRDPAQLFFPTVHLHDGAWTARARFDHALYYQTPRCPRVDGRQLPFSSFEGDSVGWRTPGDDYAGLVAPDAALLVRSLRGRLPNADTWVTA